MSYLIDTNVISELVRTKPNPNILTWFNSTPAEAIYISVLTVGELRKGVECAKEDKRKEKLRVWLEHEVINWFNNRILLIDLHVADKWGYLQQQMGRPLPVIDSLLAATALTHDLRIVTRNQRDFNYPGLKVINPWQDI